VLESGGDDNHTTQKGRLLKRLFAVFFAALLFSASFSSVRAAGPPVPLEALPLIGGSGCAISPTCPGKAQSVALHHGLHIDGSSDAQIRLGGHYTSLGGAVYLDDSSNPQYLTVYIYDTSGGAKRLIYEASITGTQSASFAIGVQGVDSIDINPAGTGRSVDIVAALAPVGGVTSPSRAGSTPGSAGHGVTTVLPGPDITLSGATIVPFAWKPYPGAAAYFLQVWLSQAAPGQAIGHNRHLNVATTTASLHYELSTAGMPKGAYRWRIAALSARGALISPWTHEGSVTLN